MTDTFEPFKVHVHDAVLDDLRRRLEHTRFPDQIDGTGWEYGTPVPYLRELVGLLARRVRLAGAGGASSTSSTHFRPRSTASPSTSSTPGRAPDDALPLLLCTAGRARSWSS